MDYDEISKTHPYETFNQMYPLSLMASQANEDVLYYHQAIKAEDSAQFREAMLKEINSFKKEQIFELIPLKNKSLDRLLILIKIDTLIDG